MFHGKFIVSLPSSQNSHHANAAGAPLEAYKSQGLLLQFHNLTPNLRVPKRALLPASTVQ